MRNHRRGDALWVLSAVLTVLFILLMSLGWQLVQQQGQVGLVGDRLQVHQLALSGIELAIGRVRAKLASPLVTPGGEVDGEVLDLFDVERARSWARSYQHELFGGSVKVTAELVRVSPNPFSTHIARAEKIPPGLEPYRAREDDDGNPVPGAQALGGWDGLLKLTAVAKLRQSRTTLEVVKAVRVADITPPAPDHTLFIAGSEFEELRDGTFHLSNLALPDKVQDRIHKLTLAMNEVLALTDVSPEVSKTLSNVEKITKRLVEAHAAGDGSELLALAAQLNERIGAAGLSADVESALDELILSLNPKDWGRVRTNGALYVYMPFFAPDDIIGYFSSPGRFSGDAQVGFPACDNRLHDPYLSVYTHYEGRIIKGFRPLGEKDDQLPHFQRYTINTRLNYASRYPHLMAVPLLARLREHAPKQAVRTFRGPAVLTGTPTSPIRLDGIWYAPEGVTVQGPYEGRGLIVSAKGITVAGDVTREDGQTGMLGLVALSGNIHVSRDVGLVLVDAGLYAEDGVRGSGSAGLKVTGNLACHTLNRRQMPRVFSCRFDPRLKNHVADNLHGSIASAPASFRVL
jgi:hypothetical protein